MGKILLYDDLELQEADVITRQYKIHSENIKENPLFFEESEILLTPEKKMRFPLNFPVPSGNALSCPIHALRSSLFEIFSVFRLLSRARIYWGDLRYVHLFLLEILEEAQKFKNIIEVVGSRGGRDRAFWPKDPREKSK